MLLAEEHGLNSGGRTRVLDATIGGQQGPVSDPLNWRSSAAYVRQKMVSVLIKEPTNMKYMSDGEDRVKILKAMVELHATSITGLGRTLTMETSDAPVGNSSEMHQTPTRVSRMQSVPVHVYPEKRGLFVGNYHYDWMQQLIMDPDTGHPGLITSETWEAAGRPEFTPDAIAATVLYYEPSPEFDRITNAYLCVNWMPKSSGEIISSRVMNAPQETVEQSIEYTATTIVGTKINLLAQKHLDSVSRVGMNGLELESPFTSVQPSVDVESQDYRRRSEELAKSIV